MADSESPGPLECNRPPLGLLHASDGWQLALCNRPVIVDRGRRSAGGEGILAGRSPVRRQKFVNARHRMSLDPHQQIRDVRNRIDRPPTLPMSLSECMSTPIRGSTNCCRTTGLVHPLQRSDRNQPRDDQHWV